MAITDGIRTMAELQERGMRRIDYIAPAGSIVWQTTDEHWKPICTWRPKEPRKTSVYVEDVDD